MLPNEGALLLLRKAAEDEALLDEVVESIRVSDAIFGFHSQQAAEKLLKATLSGAGVLYPFTHRLRDLIELIRGSGIDLPEVFDALDLLTPFAVEYRYDALPEEEEEALDRHATHTMLAQLRVWVEGRVLADSGQDPV